MGYIIGLALPVVAYRTGVQLAVYFFVAKCRRESLRQEKRGGYLRRLDLMGEDEEDESHKESNDNTPHNNKNNNSHTAHPLEVPADTPSLRAVTTAVFAMVLIAQLTSLLVYVKPHERQYAISLLFSPLGVLCRWRLQGWNDRPEYRHFPLGTLMANLAGCALSGSLGTLLRDMGTGNHIVLHSLVSGFAGSLSTLALFVVQIVTTVDVVTGRLDGLIYAFVTLFWGVVIGLLVTQSMNWADKF